MTTDLRGFDYALEPVRRQRRWELDASQARLGRVLSNLDEAKRSLEALVAQYHAQSKRAAQALAERVDPRSHSISLQWLAELRADIRRVEENIRALEEERTQARAECLARQQKLEVLDQHREECVAEFTQERDARSSSEADREWLARTSGPRSPAGRLGGGES